MTVTLHGVLLSITTRAKYKYRPEGAKRFDLYAAIQGKNLAEKDYKIVFGIKKSPEQQTLVRTC